MSARLTMLTFGYWGGGSATRELVRSVDRVERRRGFGPPIFVDIRRHRAVQTKGFVGNAFECVVRPAGYEWIPGLGNAQIRRTSRRLVRIASPSTAVELLTLAREAARERRRVIFFCSCGLPRWCHRSVVATLLLRAASA
jgi:hypothetical protein